MGTRAKQQKKNDKCAYELCYMKPINISLNFIELTFDLKLRFILIKFNLR